MRNLDALPSFVWDVPGPGEQAHAQPHRQEQQQLRAHRHKRVHDGFCFRVFSICLLLQYHKFTFIWLTQLLFLISFTFIT